MFTCWNRDTALKLNEPEYVRKIRARPLYRDDAFYRHSMALIPEYDREVTSVFVTIKRSFLVNE